MRAATAAALATPRAASRAARRTARTAKKRFCAGGRIDSMCAARSSHAGSSSSRASTVVPCAAVAATACAIAKPAVAPIAPAPRTTMSRMATDVASQQSKCAISKTCGSCRCSIMLTRGTAAPPSAPGPSSSQTVR